VIAQMSSEHAVQSTAPVIPKNTKWSRGLRLAVALVFATASWVAVVGAGYLIVQIF
jgi:hypothetical protein